jgi:hypothetical protein
VTVETDGLERERGIEEQEVELRKSGLVLRVPAGYQMNCEPSKSLMLADRR